MQRVEFLGQDPRHRSGLVLRETGLDRHLGAACALTRTNQLSDVLGQRFGAEGRLPEHDLADRLVDDLLEARHVGALLIGAEIDDTLKPGREKLLGSVLAQPDDLLDTGHTDAREAQRQRRCRRLHVDRRDARGTARGHWLTTG